MIISQYTFENESDNFEITLTHERDRSGADNVIAFLSHNKSVVSCKLFKNFSIDTNTHQLISFTNNKRIPISHDIKPDQDEWHKAHRALEYSLQTLICLFAAHVHKVNIPDVPITFWLTNLLKDD